MVSVIVTLFFINSFIWLSASAFYKSYPSPRILGGKRARITQFPYQLSFRHRNRHICGATIIKSNIGLTAGHCIIQAVPVGFSIRAGSTFIDKGGIVLPVTKILVHPEYKDEPIETNDLAVFKLSNHLIFDYRIQPIALADAYDWKNAINIKGIITGWGATSENNPLSNVLLSAEITLIDSQRCNESFEMSLPSSILCAFTLGTDTCKGDSGGPLVHNSKQIGITSAGKDCANQSLPGTYTNVAAVYDVIVNIMDSL